MAVWRWVDSVTNFSTRGKRNLSSDTLVNKNGFFCVGKILNEKLSLDNLSNIYPLSYWEVWYCSFRWKELAGLELLTFSKRFIFLSKSWNKISSHLTTLFSEYDLFFRYHFESFFNWLRKKRTIRSFSSLSSYISHLIFIWLKNSMLCFENY